MIMDKWQILDELAKNKGKVELKGKNGVHFIGGALGDIEGCRAFEEDTTKEGMYKTKYFGVAQWYKGITEPVIIDKATITKRAIKEMIGLWPLRVFRIKRFIYSVYRCEGGLKSVCLKPENFCPLCQEIIKAGKEDWAYMIAMFLQYSPSYRLRIQDWFGELNIERFKKYPILELWRVKKIALERELEIKDRVRFLFNLLMLGLIFKRKLVYGFICGINIKKVRLDGDDWYYCLRRKNYNFGGKTIQERLEMVKKIDKDWDNLILNL